MAATAIAHDEEERRRHHEEEHEDHHGGQCGGAGGGAPPSSAPAGGGVGEPLLRGRHLRRGDASADPDPDPTRSDPPPAGASPSPEGSVRTLGFLGEVRIVCEVWRETRGEERNEKHPMLAQSLGLGVEFGVLGFMLELLVN